MITIIYDTSQRSPPEECDFVSKKRALASSAVVLLLVVIVISAGGGYFYASNSLQLTIDALRNQTASVISELAALNATKQVLAAQVSNLTAIIHSLGDQIHVLQDQIPIPVKIGVLCPEEKSQSLMRVVSWIAEDEINQFYAQNAPPYEFKFIVESTEGQVNVALEKVQDFKSQGIDLVVSYLPGTEYSALSSYINSNSMVFIDAVNTKPQYVLPNDGLYRMHPTWVMQCNALAEDMWSLGKRAAIIIREDSAMMDELYGVFTARYVTKGGVVFAEVTISAEATDYSNLLTWLEGSINAARAQYGEQGVGVQVLAYTDFLSLFPSLVDYPAVSNVLWFGTEALANQPTLFTYQQAMAANIRMLSPLPYIDVAGSMYQSFYSSYRSATGEVPSYEACLAYDSCWVMAKSVVTANSTHGSVVNAFVITTSNSHQGATGLCILDANGDRTRIDYDVWGYSVEQQGFTAKKFGYYNGRSDATTWLVSP
jgi:branched-chain amino acid transport system substrate-binding protein